MRSMLDTLKLKSTRDLILLLFPIVSAAAAAIWTVITFFVPAQPHPAANPSPKTEATSPAPTPAPTPTLIVAAPAAPAPNVSAEGGVAVGGSVSNSTITVSSDHPR